MKEFYVCFITDGHISIDWYEPKIQLGLAELAHTCVTLCWNGAGKTGFSTATLVTYNRSAFPGRNLRAVKFFENSPKSASRPHHRKVRYVRTNEVAAQCVK